jgi:hypothetical protein
LVRLRARAAERFHAEIPVCFFFVMKQKTIDYAIDAPVRGGRSIHVAVSGDDQQVGSVEAPFKTISRAAEVAQPGDIITVHEGVYRERINPPRGGTSDARRIVYRAAPGETVVVKGSERVTGWKRVDENTWTVNLPNRFFGDFNPFRERIQGNWFESKRPYHAGAVYLHGHWLFEAPKKSVLLPVANVDGEEGGREELMNLQKLVPSSTGGGRAKRAIDFVSKSDEVGIVDLPDGEKAVGRMCDGSHVTYDIECGEDTMSLAIFTASPVEGGWVEVRLGGPDGKLLGRFDAGFTAEWHSFQPFHTEVGHLTGRQRITLVFKARPQNEAGDAAEKSYWFAEVGESMTTIWAQFKGVDPNEANVEINVRPTVFYPDAPGRNYITVEGFILEQASPAWAPPTAEQVGLIGTHWSKGWLIQRNTIRYSVCTGLTLGKHGDEFDNVYDMVGMIERGLANGWNRETIGSHLVRDNHILHCGQAGIVGCLGCAFSTITGNVIHDIRKHHQYGGCESAGIKLHGFVDGVISRNHIYNCEHWGGIWFDWMAQGARITANVLHDNSQDLMFEVNHGPCLVDHNLLLSGQRITEASGGGAFVHNLIWADINIWPELQQRFSHYFKPHSTEPLGEASVDQDDDRYVNNIFIGRRGTAAYDKPGFRITSTGNVFLGGALPCAQEREACVDMDFDPQIRLLEEPGGWFVEMRVDRAWLTKASRTLVTTENMGRASVPDALFEQADGTPYDLNVDFSGDQRPEAGPAPGPFEWRDATRIQRNVWPLTPENI